MNAGKINGMLIGDFAITLALPFADVSINVNAAKLPAREGISNVNAFLRTPEQSLIKA